MTGMQQIETPAATDYVPRHAAREDVEYPLPPSVSYQIEASDDYVPIREPKKFWRGRRPG
jgi:hypothetical protein